MENKIIYRMAGFYSQTFSKMMSLRTDRKDFVGDDDLGVFYRNQRLLTMMREGKINSDNISEMMTKENMSDGMIPVEWYYLNEDVVPKDEHYSMLYRNFEVARQRMYKRGALTRKKLKMLMHEILMRRVDKYEHPEKYINNKILCIVGESGAGKTLCSLHLQNKFLANVICSFTTRPPRPTEVEGREHHFINILPDPNDLLAYTIFGGYEYYALKTQVYGDCTVYVIDEAGLENLRREHGNEYKIYSVYIRRDKEKKIRTGVSKKRINRDKNRFTLPDSSYDWIIENNSTKKNLFINIERIYNTIKNK